MIIIDRNLIFVLYIYYICHVVANSYLVISDNISVSIKHTCLFCTETADRKRLQTFIRFQIHKSIMIYIV